MSRILILQNLTPQLVPADPVGGRLLVGAARGLVEVPRETGLTERVVRAGQELDAGVGVGIWAGVAEDADWCERTRDWVRVRGGD